MIKNELTITIQHYKVFFQVAGLLLFLFPFGKGYSQTSTVSSDDCNQDPAYEVKITGTSCSYKQFDKSDGDNSGSSYWTNPSYYSCSGTTALGDGWGWFVAMSTSTTIKYKNTGGNTPKIHVFTNCAHSNTAVACVGVDYQYEQTLSFATTIGQVYHFRIQVGNSTGEVCVYSNVPLPQPTITGFTPSTGCTGTTVTISGTNFYSVSSVTIGGTAATIVDNSSPTTLTVKVGAGTTGMIEVTTGTGLATSADTFTFDTGAGDPLGSTECNPFTNISQIEGLADGAYYFNFGGETLKTTVKNGWLLVANDIDAPISQDLAEVAILDETIRGIAPAAFLSNLGNIGYTRISSSDAALDIVTSNSTILSRVKSAQTLHEGDPDNTINDTWTGTSAGNITADATCHSAVIALKARIVHTCGVATGMNWIPKDGLRQIHYPDNVANNVSFGLWVKYDFSWTGATDTDWSKPANWSTGAVPTETDNITIPDVTNDPVIGASTTASCANLILASGAFLTLNSDATGTGSLLISGTLSNSGTITSQHYLKGAAQTWHMIGAPVAGGIAANGWNPTAGQDDFYTWDEPTPGTWVNYDNTGTPSFETVNGSFNFMPGKGYLVAYNAANLTKTFTGTLSTGNVNFNLKRSSAKSWTYSSGWNLLANPYSSAIDWNVATRTQFEDNFAYAYNPNKSGGEGYVSIDGSQANAHIAPHQAFFVRATQAANNQNFTFSSTIQSHGGTNYKSAAEQPATIILRLANATNYDETSIRLMGDSEATRDRNDALKMYSFNPAIPQLYSLSQDEAPLAVNSHAQIAAEQPIRLGMKLPAAGSYTLSLEQADAQLTGNGLFVEDTQTGLLHKLSENPYTFNASEGDISSRFLLHFGLVGQNEKTEVLPFVVYESQQRIYLQTKETWNLLRIYDLSGRELYSQLLDGSNLQLIKYTPIGSAVLIIRLEGNGKVISQKLPVVR